MWTREGMPYNTNVWYHVTERSNLPRIQREGLIGSQHGTDRNFNLPVEENAVYLHPNLGMAHSWMESFRQDPGPWQKRSLQDPVVLRVNNVDRRNLAPDHESVDTWLEETQRDIEDEPGKVDRDAAEIAKWIDAYEEKYPLESFQDGSGRNAEFTRNIQMLREMPPEWRERIARDISAWQGDPVMHYGPIHPDKIEVGDVHVADDDAMERWHEENPGKDDNDFYEWAGAEPGWWAPGDLAEMDSAGYEDPEDDSFTGYGNWQPLRTMKFTKLAIEEDNWTSPRSDKLFHNVGMPGNAPGLNPEGDLPIQNIKRPCYCGVGLMSPHEHKPGQCEYPMPMRKAAALDQNWVYFDGKVGFGRHWWEIVKELAQDEDEDTQSYLSNMISRNSLPTGLDLAVGTMQGGRPQIFSSNVDRNHVWDTVMQSAPS